MALDKLTKVQSVGISSFIQVVGVVTATQGFDGNITGNVTGNITGNVTGNVTGNITGIITATGDLTFGANSRAKLFENGTQSGVQATNSSSSAHLMTHDGNEDIHVDPSGYIKFEVAGSERLRITSDGKVAIGFNAPAVAGLSLANSSTSLGFEFDTASGFAGGPTIRGYHRPSTAYKSLGITGADIKFGINDVEKLRLDSNGYLGLNNAAPHNQYYNNLVIGDGSASGDKGITIRTQSSNEGVIAFSDADSGAARYAGKIAYSHSTNAMMFFTTNGDERLRIDSGGTVHVNSPDTASGGRIYAASSKLYLQSGNGRQSFNIADMAPGQSATHEFNSSGNLVLASGSGIDFSANSNASGMTSEVLDDYEEGTWTPQLLGGTSNPSLTYSAQSGGYEKIGSLVHLSFFMHVSAVNSQGSGYLELHGLPHIPVTSPLGASEVPALVLQTQPFADGKAANRFAFCRTVGGSSRMFVGYRDLTTNNAIIPTNAAANISTGYFIGHITYRAS